VSDFFEGLDQLLASSTVVIDRPAGTVHPRDPAVVYPVDQGYLGGTTSADGHGIDVFVGTATGTGIVAAVTVDPGARDTQVRLILDCTQDEVDQVEHLLAQALLLSTRVLRRRGSPPTSPLLEFDTSRPAFIEPTDQIRPHEVPEACVITFFGDSVQRLLDEGARVVARNQWEDGPHLLLEIEHQGRRVAVLHSGVGAPLAAGLLEESIAMGCRAFVVCGGAGALRQDLTVGHLVVVRAALRDEGTSHHYLPAGRWVDLDAEATRILEQTLTEHGVPFVSGPTWTTDAPYRETPQKIAARRDEGCITVEMESAALAAVASFRGVRLAQVLYSGDDLSGEIWDNRDWQSSTGVRDHLIRLAGSAALRIADELASPRTIG